ncbi:Os11g0583650 [Oryza sativa Japonica Group]|uniref:Os11g0583650 protein n=1 Tax=Oryza sativa subsp. japonica TaxID=39947 RepID=A0A0P0Y3M9_ORYSJ|nr:Os11g0583650 [Oryza sativa Japonica Group]
MRTDFRRRGGRAEGGYNNNLVFWVLSSKKSPSTAPIAASHRDAASSRRRALPHHRAQETTSAAVACRPGGDSVLQRLRPRRAILAAARPLPVRQEACLIRALAAVSSSPRAADTSCSPPPLAPRVDGKKKGKKSCTPPRRAGSATATAGVVVHIRHITRWTTTRRRVPALRLEGVEEVGVWVAHLFGCTARRRRARTSTTQARRRFRRDR